jgi:PAS domain S-box-containing protein
MNDKNKTKVQLISELEELRKKVQAISGIEEREKDILESDEMVHTIISSIDDLIFVIDDQGIFLNYYLTEDTEQLFVPPEAFIGKSYKTVLPPDIANKLSSAILAIKRTNKVQQFDYSMEVEGVIKWFDAKVSLYKNAAGKFAGITAVVRNITERKNIEETLRENKNRLKSIFRVSPMGIGVVNDRVIMDVNPYICELTGYAKEELIGKNARILYPSEQEYNFVGEEKYRQINMMGSGKVETRWKKKDGSVIDILLASTSIDPDDQQKGVTFTALDITEQKNIENALKEREIFYRTLFKLSPSGILMEDSEGYIWDVNPAFSHSLGYSREDLIGKHVRIFTHPDELIDVDKNIEDVLNGKQISHYEKSIKKDGTVCYLGLNEKKLTLPDGREGILCVTEDVTERKQVLDALQKEKEFYRTLFELSPSGIILEDNEGNILEVNPAFCHSVGYTSKELIGKNVRILGNPENPVEIEKHIQLLLNGKQLKHSVRDRKKDGTICYLELNEKMVQLPDGRDGILCVMEDVTERKNAENALRKSEHFLKESQKVALIGSYILDVESGNWENSIFLDDLFGIGPSFKKDIAGWLQIVHDDDREKMQGYFTHNVLTMHEPFNKEYRITRLNDKQERWVHGMGQLEFDPTGQPIRMLGTIQDITLRKQAEAEKINLEKLVRRNQKLETIGTLAGGIAHDFNNILTPILGYTDMAVLELEESDPLRHNLNIVLEGAYRAKDLIEQMLLFSKQIEKERIPLSLQLIVKEALKLLRSSIPATVEIVQKIDPRCEKILADATQIHQVIVNLCTNAWQVMEQNGGTLTVGVKQVVWNKLDVKLQQNLKEEKYICLTVQDTGKGMDEGTVERIFEPFFTTKSVDKGTGLGLSVVHGIIQSHRGDILIKSKLDVGTTFQVFLPVMTEPSESKKVVFDKLMLGKESIMVVDDDKVVGTMVKQMLEQFGYSVDLFQNSKKALGVFKECLGKYDLLISDLTMPNFTGIQLSEKIQKLKPGFPVIITTGFGHKLLGIDLEKYGIKYVIEKPIVMNEFSSAIRAVFND